MPIKLGTISKIIPYSKAYLGEVLKYKKNKSLQYYGTIETTSTSGGNQGTAKIGDYAIFVKDSFARAYNSSLVASSPSILSTPRNNQGRWGNSNSNYAIFCGGSLTSSSSTRSNVVDAYDMNLNRTTASTLSKQKYRLTTTTINDSIIVAGGATGSSSTSTNTVEGYDSNLTKSTLSSLSSSRQLCAGASNGLYAFIGGGVTSSHVNTVEKYNTNLTKSASSALSAARSRLTGCKIGDYAAFAGGQSSSSPDKASSVVDVYDSNAVRTTVQNLASERLWLDSASNDEIMIIAGGQNTSWVNQKTTDVITKDLIRYQGPDMSVGRGSGSYIQAIGKYFVFLGGGSAVTEVFKYD